MVTSRCGRIAAVDIDNAPQVRRGRCRRRTTIVYLAAVLLLAFASIACKKEEPVDEEPVTLVEESTTDERPSEQVEEEEQVSDGSTPATTDLDPNPESLPAVLDGSWRSVGTGFCTEVVLDLIRPSFGYNATAFFYPSPGHSLQLYDLHRLDDNGLGGMAPEGGPFVNCAEPRQAKFVARRAANRDFLEIRWLCILEGDQVVRDETRQYQRGSCSGGAVLPPSEDGGDDGGLVTTLREDGVTETSPDDGDAEATTPPDDGEREPGRLCKGVEFYSHYNAPPEACGRCEASCRETCARVGSTLLGECQSCDVSPTGGACGHCMMVCLFPQNYD